MKRTRRDWMGGTKVGSQTFSVRSGDIGNRTSGDMGYTFGRRACPGLQGFSSRSIPTRYLSRPDLKRPVVVTLRRWVVPNIGRQLLLERCIQGATEQLQSRIRPEGNSA